MSQGPTHTLLPCGVECAVLPLPDRHVATFQLRVLAGAVDEPEDRLGLASVVEEVMDKGTQNKTGRELHDEFDAIGAMSRSGAGRESTTFTCTVLPEHFEKALSLYTEIIRSAAFPDEACRVALELTRQEITGLDDDAQGLADKMIHRHAFGSRLGRHTLGEIETLKRIRRDDFLSFWKSYYGCGRIVFTAAGAIEPRRVESLVQQNFDGFGAKQRSGRVVSPIEFSPGMHHLHKELEQEQIALCWPGVDPTHSDYPIQQVLVGVLSGGMSGRLFTEVREKLGLVYWVAAWQDTPRGGGMIFLGASTTPDRCDKTYHTLLSELDRLGDDIASEEIQRAVTGIAAHQETRGDATRSRCAELSSDLFYYDRPIPIEDKLAKLQAVTPDDLRRFLEQYPRDRRCVVTLGPRPLEGATEVGN